MRKVRNFFNGLEDSWKDINYLMHRIYYPCFTAKLDEDIK